MNFDDFTDIDRFNAAARKGRRIDRIFRARCAKYGIDPEIAKIAGPLLSLALAKIDAMQNLRHKTLRPTA